MNFDDSETYRSSSDDVVRQRDRNWKAVVVVLALAFAVCIVGAVVASQKDRDVASVGEKAHRVGLFIGLLGLVGFLMGRRLETFWNWLNNQMIHLDDDAQIAVTAANEAASSAPADTPQTGSRFQFSLGTFFLVTMGMGITAGLLFSLPGELLVIFTYLCHLMVTVTLTMVLIYGRGYLRTFCIGALITAGTVLVGSFGVLSFRPFLYEGLVRSDSDLLIYRILVLCEWIAAVLLGLYGIFVRVMVERSSNTNARRP